MGPMDAGAWGARLEGGAGFEQLLAQLSGERPGTPSAAGAVPEGVTLVSEESVRANVRDFSYSNRDPDFRLRPAEDFDPGDLAVLEEIIRLNGLDESSSDFDYNDGDGVLDPRELGDQRWCNGRLRELKLGPDFFSSFGYQVRQLPPSIADLDGLMVLEANSVGLRSLPDEVTTLSNLRRLSLYNNSISALPEAVGDLPALEEIQATGNRIRRLPDGIDRSQSLERVFVDMGSLAEMPAMLVRQQRALVDGELEIPARQLGPLDARCSPSS